MILNAGMHMKSTPKLSVLADFQACKHVSYIVVMKLHCYSLIRRDKEVFHVGQLHLADTFNKTHQLAASLLCLNYLVIQHLASCLRTYCKYVYESIYVA